MDPIKSCLDDLTAAIEDVNSKLDIYTFDNVDIEESVADRLVTANSLATAGFPN